LQIFLIFRFYLGRLARGRECDAAHWPLTAYVPPPGLAARGRGRDAAHLLLLDPGSRLGHGKNVVKNFSNEIIGHYAVPNVDPVLRLCLNWCAGLFS
jgi:hypothetical protein